MPKDLRELFKNEPMQSSELSKKHRKNFEAKLQKELHGAKINYNQFLKIAASFLIVVGLGSSIFYFSNTVVQDAPEISKIESLGDISPELKKIENYYLASIQNEFSTLDPSPENKEFLDGYLERIGDLTNKYKVLTAELNTPDGLNEKTINGLIDNLQLRLKLMYQLKEQLNKLKNQNLKSNEDVQV